MRFVLILLLFIQMQRRVESRSVHDLGTYKENAIAQCRLLTNFASKHVFESVSHLCDTPQSFTDSWGVRALACSAADLML